MEAVGDTAMGVPPGATGIVALAGRATMYLGGAGRRLCRRSPSEVMEHAESEDNLGNQMIGFNTVSWVWP